ncbi:uncharacterized protein EV422DRAFT_499078, partial [Fimicolochytrium jonesii]|uniref:uncharacterized protein n=1 Tax=Fimicolochytrium jonesii TaxID=1396493 RepID=UPI0022FECF16
MDPASPPRAKATLGKQKLPMRLIGDKTRRGVTFSKRKNGLLKKAYELTRLTGTQALLLIASETGQVYTFATPRLQPVLNSDATREHIQRCLNDGD